MTRYFVTRHTGALDWAERHGVHIDRRVDHLDPSWLGAGDEVLGTLPVPMAERICARGARYFHLVLDMPRDLRGQDLDAETLDALGAHLDEYFVRRREDG